MTIGRAINMGRTDLPVTTSLLQRIRAGLADLEMSWYINGIGQVV